MRGDRTDTNALCLWGWEVSLLFWQDEAWGARQSSTDSAGPRNSTQSCLGLEGSHPQPAWTGNLKVLLSPFQHLAYPQTATEEPNSGMGGLAVLRCNSAAALGLAKMSSMLDCGQGGCSVPGNLKNVFEDKISCFTAWGFCCRLLPSICRLWSASLYLSSFNKTILFSVELAVGFALFLNKATPLGTAACWSLSMIT